MNWSKMIEMYVQHKSKTLKNNFKLHCFKSEQHLYFYPTVVWGHVTMCEGDQGALHPNLRNSQWSEKMNGTGFWVKIRFEIMLGKNKSRPNTRKVKIESCQNGKLSNGSCQNGKLSKWQLVVQPVNCIISVDWTVLHSNWW